MHPAERARIHQLIAAAALSAKDLKVIAERFIELGLAANHQWNHVGRNRRPAPRTCALCRKEIQR